MRVLTWLFRGLVFFVLFAFAMNNLHPVELQWFWGYKSQAPMVFIVLAVFSLGCATGVLAMVPSWWRHRRDARQRLQLLPEKAVAPTPTTTHANSRSGGHSTLPAELPHPPDMPAPRKPGK
ncbi:LapA family protein [Aquabacterium sp.]|uniref:LapA family protein n=1 Tax=Aquabacterium sp. TaxID=1872578 RepID=UPI003D6D2E2C